MTAPAAETAERVFVSWLRRGLGVHIGSGATADGRASIRVTLDVERRLDAGGPEVRPVTVTLPMFGPDDVTGIDPRAVVRTWPQADVSDAEQNGVPLVEFSEPDLPWRYSPQGPVDDRILPWMCLIVLAEGEFTLLPSGQDRPLAVVQVNDGVRLPNRADAWAWAHAEVRGVAAVNDAVPSRRCSATRPSGRCRGSWRRASSSRGRATRPWWSPPPSATGCGRRAGH
jgi:hypothetical protein